MPSSVNGSPRQPMPGVLDPAERDMIAAQFGVGTEQVIRDHAISHTLAAIAADGVDDLVFFGGTALARTHLPNLRLSEDIDLIAIGDRRGVAERIERAIARRLRPTIGTPTFTPSIGVSVHREQLGAAAPSAREKMMREPSGDHAGTASAAGVVVSFYTSAPA